MKGDHLANETLMARTFDAVDGSVAGIGPLLLIFLGISSAVRAPSQISATTSTSFSKKTQYEMGRLKLTAIRFLPL